MSQGDLTPERERLCRDFGRSLRALVHDINNPLALISAQAQMIEMKSGDHSLPPDAQDDLRRRLRVIREGVARCELVFARYRAMYRSPSPVPRAVPLSAVVRSLVGDIGQQPVDERLAVQDAPEVAVWADLDAVRLALGEVIRNARQATQRSGRTTVGFSVGDDSVSVTVVDDGVGMTPDVVARAFDPYFSAWEGFEAAGIGLCIAHASLSSFGGVLRLTSDGPGRGAECAAILPLAR